MTATAQALRPPSRTLLLLEGRAIQELGAFMLLRPWLAAAPRGDGHPVLVFPGLLASDFSTRKKPGGGGSGSCCFRVRVTSRS